MDFNSLGQGSPFYILRRTDSKPVLEVGTVKSKTMPQPMYTGTPMNDAIETVVIKKALGEKNYHENVLTEGEKMLETLNPRYAEEKNQARTMAELQNRVNDQDKKLDDMKALMDKILTAVQPK